ncbi:MAG: ribonuclease H-like YkuK family protein [Firmicutes bacterium]|nr:ribonuclease H-like YkuK family protein [Bacillota bacterium]
MRFISPTKGVLTFDEMFKDILDYVRQDPEATYRLIIGTDSRAREEITFVSAVVIHRVGKGARYYYEKRKHSKLASLRQRIYYETALSLDLGSKIAARLARNGQANLDVEIHLDVGLEGATKSMIREVVGMVTGSGFDAKIKPESYGASVVADKYTK